MSSTIEDRLTAALEARAEQVTPEDLRPLEVPQAPGRHVGAGVLLLAAAVTAAVVATPFVLTRDGGAPSSGPAGTPSVVPSPSGEAQPSPTGPPPPVVTVTPTEVPENRGKLKVAARQWADVDGDGQLDRVRLLTDATGPEEPGERSELEVTLAAGGAGFAEVPPGYADLLPGFAINRDGQEQVLLSHTQGGDSASLLVYTWLDGSLVQARKDGKAPLALELDGQGTVADYVTDDRGLLSWLRLDRVSGSTYRVRQWTWILDGDQLVPTSAGKGCVDVTSGEAPGLTNATPGPC